VNPTTAETSASALTWVNFPSHWPGQGDLLQWCATMGPGTAALLVLAGVIYLLFGWYMFRVLVMLNAALLGAYVGALLGHRGNAAAAGAFLGGFTAAAITWPLMKYAIAVMGGIFGAVLGASIWRTCGLEPSYAWAGGMTGLVGFGMLSFILFRGSIMMFTSLQGSVMLVFGILGLIYKYQDIAPAVTSSITIKPFLLPALIFIPTILGLIYQQAQYGSGGGGGAAEEKKS
jgi:hypothetical protein